MIPFDGYSLTVIGLAIVVLVTASRIRATTVRIALVLAAALIIRTDAAWQHSLYPWDERYHALVAKHLIDSPLTPTLYRTPYVAYDYRDWTQNHIWLHKPPLALWLMAASMNLFGAAELPMRLPSVVLSTAAVLLTFSIGARLFSERVGLLAAGFQAVNGFLVALSAGRRVADHVDTALIFFVELGVWVALRYRDDRRRSTLLLSGLTLGAALLTKSLPGLLIVPVAALVFLEKFSVRDTLTRCALILLIACLVVAPWLAFIWRYYPREAAWSGLYTLMHVSNAVEGQDAGPLTYVRDMPRFFGEAVWISLLGAAILAQKRRVDGLKICLAWIAIMYVVFSFMTTRLPGYVMVAAPALFLVQAYFWFEVRAKIPLTRGLMKAALTVFLVVLTLLPARYLLEPTGSFERRDRTPALTRELMALAGRLQLPDAVIFNMPTPIEAMFYSPYTAYSRMPTDEDLKDCAARKIPVVIYIPDGRDFSGRADWPVVWLRQGTAGVEWPRE